MGGGSRGGGHSPNVKVWEVLCEVGVTGGEGVLRGLFPLPVPSSVAPPHGDPPLHTDPPPGALYDTGRAVGGVVGGGEGKAPKCQIADVRVSVTWWQYTKQVNKNVRKFKHSGEGRGERGAKWGGPTCEIVSPPQHTQTPHPQRGARWEADFRVAFYFHFFPSSFRISLCSPPQFPTLPLSLFFPYPFFFFPPLPFLPAPH